MKPTAQGQVESSINDTINFIMAKVAAGEIDAATATELIAAARKDYESNVPVTTSAQQAVQLQQTAKSLTMSYCVENLKQGRKPELTIFTSKKRTFPQAFSVRKSVVQAVEKFLQKEKLYVKRDTNVPFSARPEKKAPRTAKVHSYPRSILKAQFSMS